uniref:Lysosome-associated membrane glycoprotein 5 n=1 Tax=Bos indicus x Bos taurus TaxID=30522 RepID=A0A4W2E2J6_BOBOX
MAEQEVENLSGLSTNPEKDIFVVRENGTTCLMAEFAAKFIVPYDVWASNYVDLITEQADISLTRGAEVKGHCGHDESELQVFWVDRAYALKMLFLKESHNTPKGPEATWKLSKVQFVYDSSEKTHFKDAVSAGKHTANSHHLSALVTPAGKSYECQAQQTISLASSDPQKTVTMILSAVHIQPFDIISDFVFSEGRWVGSPEEGEVDSGWRQKVTCRVPGCYPWVVSRVAWLCLPLQRFLKTTGSRLKKWLFLLFLSPSCPSFPLSFSLCSFSPFSQFPLFFSIVFFLPSFGKRGDWIGRQSVGKKPRI